LRCLRSRQRALSFREAVTGVVAGSEGGAAMCTKQNRAPWDGVLRSIIKV